MLGNTPHVSEYRILAEYRIYSVYIRIEISLGGGMTLKPSKS